MTLDDLDGVAIAPGNHHVLFENEEVRVIEITIAAGETTPLHTHASPTVLYTLSGSQFVRRDERGATMFDSRADPAFVMPRVSYNPALPRHTIENTGDDDLLVIGVELKHPHAIPGPAEVDG
jgi:mannose-6-phosphate isomerase-like protein (cupin superfamily)